MLNKKGSIPVTMLVILTIVIFVVLLIAFSFIATSLLSKVKSGYNSVQRYNFNVIQNDFFTGEKKADPVRETSKEYWFFGPEKIEISVFGARG